MDVIESSHFEVVKKWLQDNPRYELKVRSYVENTNRFWEFKIHTSNLFAKSPIEFTEIAMSFGSALTLISKRLREAGESNGSNG